MRARVLTAAASIAIAAVGAIALDASPAWAGDGSGAYTSTSGAAEVSGGTLTVDAGVTTWTPPSGSHWATAAKSDPPPTGKPNPNQPYGCTYSAGGAQATAMIGVGGPQPGQWVFPVCAGPGVIDPMPPFWVTGAQPPAAVVVQASPVTVALHAARQLALSSPSIEMAPPPGHPQLVGVATWLWVDPAGWHPFTASTSAGDVTTTATAVPSKVVWDMGDGATVTCDGPGTPYDPADPGGSTACSYTWPAPGSFTVTATTYWSVTWTATGAAGGGSLGLLAGPAAEVAVTVTQSQAINTAGAGGS